jgi:hypothetical protein
MNNEMTASTADAVDAGTNLSADAMVDVLRQERENWESTQLKASNEALYEVLAKCLRFYYLMAENTAGGTTLRTEFEAVLTAKKLKFASTTHTVVKIIRVVFDTDVKRASAFGTALRMAIENSIRPKDFAAFVRQNGGIEALRKQDTAAATEKASDKAERAWTALNGRVLATVASDALKKVTDLAKIGHRVVLLATHRADGTYEIHEVITAASVVNAAYAAQTKPADTKLSVVPEPIPVNDTPDIDDAAARRQRALKALLAA